MPFRPMRCFMSDQCRILVDIIADQFHHADVDTDNSPTRVESGKSVGLRAVDNKKFGLDISRTGNAEMGKHYLLKRLSRQRNNDLLIEVAKMHHRGLPQHHVSDPPAKFFPPQ